MSWVDKSRVGWGPGMSRVEKAIESGRCAIAVGASLLRDPEVMLALTQRAALTPMALGGPTVAPVVPVSADPVARAVSQPGGLVVLVEPEPSDQAGLKQLGDLIQRAKHRPDVIVVSRAFNPFAFGAALSGLKVAHEKGRGKAFLQSLPEARLEPSGSAPSEAAKADVIVPKIPKRGHEEVAAPRFCFVGRDEEVESLAGLLGTGGPIVISGPPGVGRTQLLEHAIKKAGLKRYPDIYLGWGAAADTLVARIAAIGKSVGDNRLHELVLKEHTFGSGQPNDVIKLASEILQNEALKGNIQVIHHLEYGLGRENDFFRRSRFELLLIGLLTHTAALPIVFISTRQPSFHREGEGANLRRVEVAGIKGRFLHEIFDAYKSIEFPREKFGPISERIHGHPLAARTFAIATRIRKDGAEIVDDPKFLAAESVRDVAALEKHLARRIEKLPEPLRKVLARLAHLRMPVDGGALANDLGVKRDQRLELLSLGLLDMTGTEDDRKYRVHPLVKAQLPWREITDFEVCEKLADLFKELAQKASGLEKLAIEQEQNRFAVASRALRLRPRLELPDHDMWLESVAGMLRAKQPRLDLVEQRLNEALKQNPHNADAWLLKLELAQYGDVRHRDDKHGEGRHGDKGGDKGEGRAEARHGEGKQDAIDAILEEAIAKAPVPELFQQAVSYLLSRRQRTRAISVLEKGVQIFPNESRLHTRLAAVLMRQGRRNEAIEHLKRAMEIDPMLPDSYGLLGMARRDEGMDSLAEAETLLREAVRLAPEDPVQIARLVDLLLERARVDVEKMVPLRAEAKALLEEAIKGDRRAPEACLLYATLLREEGGDLERASWLLGQARKLTDRGHERSRRIGVERALIDLARGDLDAAEQLLRAQVSRDPSHARAFAALGHVLEAREQFIPAHAEYMRAKERTAQNSLECLFYDQQLQRVQGIIEAQAAGLWQPEPKPERPPEPPPPTQRVVRRRGAHRDAHDRDGQPGDAQEAQAGEQPSEEGDPERTRPSEHGSPTPHDVDEALGMSDEPHDPSSAGASSTDTPSVSSDESPAQ